MTFIHREGAGITVSSSENLTAESAMNETLISLPKGANILRNLIISLLMSIITFRLTLFIYAYYHNKFVINHTKVVHFEERRLIKGRLTEIHLAEMRGRLKCNLSISKPLVTV